MGLSIAVVTPPAVEPVTVSAAKRHLRIDWDDDDEYVADLIVAARDWLERKTGRALITRTLRAVFDLPIAESAHGPVGGIVGYPPTLAFSLPYPPFGAVTLAELEQDVELWKTLTLAQPGGAMGDYVVDGDSEPARVWLHSSALSVWMPSWDWTGARTPRARVTYSAGYGATGASVPGPLRQALYRVVAHQYENREAAGTPPDSLVPLEYLRGWL